MSEPRILVVDDNKDMRWLVSNLLKAENYDVDVADSGMVALEKIRQSDARRLRSGWLFR